MHVRSRRCIDAFNERMESSRSRATCETRVRQRPRSSSASLPSHSSPLMSRSSSDSMSTIEVCGLLERFAELCILITVTVHHVAILRGLVDDIM